MRWEWNNNNIFGCISSISYSKWWFSSHICQCDLFLEEKICFKSSSRYFPPPTPHSPSVFPNKLKPEGVLSQTHRHSGLLTSVFSIRKVGKNPWQVENALYPVGPEPIQLFHPYKWPKIYGFHWSEISPYL